MNEIGSISLKNVGCFSACLDIIYIDREGRRKCIKCSKNVAPGQCITVEPCLCGVPDGALITAFVYVEGGKDRESCRIFIYRKCSKNTAAFKIGGTAACSVLEFEGITIPPESLCSCKNELECFELVYCRSKKCDKKEHFEEKKEHDCCKEKKECDKKECYEEKKEHDCCKEKKECDKKECHEEKKEHDCCMYKKEYEKQDNYEQKKTSQEEKIYMIKKLLEENNNYPQKD